MAKPITIKITGDSSGFSKTLGDVDSKLGSFGKMAAGIGKVAAVGLGAVGVAAGAAAVKGVTAFADFEKSMNEVFTLMPGISAEAMSGMEDQVKNFSKEFGVLPEETIPALYQSLSAGVPADNVFSFMETAQKAAKGGVTDLSTAVDGISSVVNAYGEEIVSSTEASDLMFTAVRLGKTTFEEMSASLSNVTPIASGLGVGFDEVTGSIAALTAKGVPTAQATTQIRAALSDLAKEGTKSDIAFRDLTGGGFQDFIASGGTMAEAFQLLNDHAEDSGKSVLDMFGSVEGGQAVMALTANGGEDFASVLEEMGNSAGATDAAFQTMDGGLSSAFEKIKATFSVLLIDIGEKLAPTIEAAAGWIADNSDRISAAFDTAMEFMGNAIEVGVVYLGKLWTAIQEYVIPAARVIIEHLGMAVEWVRENWPEISATFQEVWTVIEGVVGFITTAIEWFTERFAQGASDAEASGSGMMALFESVRTTVVSAFEAISTIIQTVVAVVTVLWQTFGAEITAVVTTLVSSVMAVLGGFFEILSGIFDLITSLLTGKWGAAWDAIVQILSGVIEVIVGVLALAWETIQLALAVAWEVIKVAFALAWEAIKAVFSGAIDAIVALLALAWEVMKTALSVAWDAIKAVFSATWDAIKAVFSAAIDAVKATLSAAWDAIKATVSATWDAIKATLSTAWDGIKLVVSGAIDAVKTKLSETWDAIKATVSTVWDAIKTVFSNAWDGMRLIVSGGIDYVVEYVGGLPGRIASAVSGAFNGLKDEFRNVVNGIIGMWNGFSFPSWTIPSVDLPGIGKIGGGTIGGWSTPNIPLLAQGGVITAPTLAMIGEDSRTTPEIVTPERLMRQIVREEGGRSGGPITIEQHFHGFSTEEARRLAREGTSEALREVRQSVRSR